jgi:hypothetical protein
MLQSFGVEQVVARCRLEDQQLELAAGSELGALTDDQRLRPLFAHGFLTSLEVVMAVPNGQKPTGRSPDSAANDA